MSNGDHPLVWSECSNYDLKMFYSSWLGRCLKETQTNTTQTTSTTASSTSTTTITTTLTSPTSSTTASLTSTTTVLSTKATKKTSLTTTTFSNQTSPTSTETFPPTEESTTILAFTTTTSTATTTTATATDTKTTATSTTTTTTTSTTTITTTTSYETTTTAITTTEIMTTSSWIDCLSYNIGYKGDNLKKIYTETIHQCQEECKTEPRCEYWSYTRSPRKHHNCYIKCDKGNPTTLNGFVSGDKTCTPDMSLICLPSRWEYKGENLNLKKLTQNDVEGADSAEDCITAVTNELKLDTKQQFSKRFVRTVSFTWKVYV